jgi:hypothetical protein
VPLIWEDRTAVSERISVAGEAIASLVDDYLLASAASADEEWGSLLEEVRAMTLSGSLASKGYWIDLYRARQETAVAVDTGMAGDLARVVDELSRFDDDPLALIMVNRSGYGYLIWTSSDFSSVAFCIRVKDKRRPSVPG